MKQSKSTKIVAMSFVMGIGFLLFVWWLLAALGVLEIISMLLKPSLLGWMKREGFWRYYLLGGSITSAIILVKYGIPAAFSFVRGFANDPVQIIGGIVVLGAIPILAIPLITIGWPIFWYYAIKNLFEQNRKTG
jgi:hypothetical protein